MFAIFRRTLYFLISFTFVFWIIHQQFESTISRSTLNGLSGFYSADGVIFGLVLAFVIQREWELWINLSESVRTEIDAVREMWKWSDHVGELRDGAHQHLKRYLALIVAEWNAGHENVRSTAVDAELDGLRTLLVRGSRATKDLNFPLQNAFTTLVRARDIRLNFSNEHMPGILKRIVIFADILLIVLSLFIAVNNVFLDYLFTGAISLLAFVMILVIDDLDNPFRPGSWHLTTDGYESLFKELTRGKDTQ